MSVLFRSKLENQIDETRRPRNLIKSARRNLMLKERGAHYGRGHNFNKEAYLRDKDKYEKQAKARAAMLAKHKTQLENSKQKVI